MCGKGKSFGIGFIFLKPKNIHSTWAIRRFTLPLAFVAACAVGKFTKQKISFATKDIRQEGYIFVWLSYEDDSDNWVYFDDFKVTHTKSNIIQYNEYYPFGLQTSNSWTRDNNKNQYLYNGANELNSTTGWYEMFYRGYDPTTGRMLQIDPYAHLYAGYTPYNYAGNNPVGINDPSGGLLMVTASGQMLGNYDYSMSYSQWEASVGGGGGGGGGYGGRHGGTRSNNGPSLQQWADALVAAAPDGRTEMSAEAAASVLYSRAFLVETELGNFITTDRSFRKSDRWYRATSFNLFALTAESLAENGIAQQGDPADDFWFIRKESDAYKFMLAIQNLPNGSGKEVVGVLSVNQTTGDKGVLILPWSGNDYNLSNAGKGFNGTFYEDNNGTRYTPLAFVHTHAENDIGPLTWPGDLRIARDHQIKIPMYILGDLNYVQYWPSSSPTGSTYDLIRDKNPVSLFPK
jgi:RHS repeat-associated protein